MFIVFFDSFDVLKNLLKNYFNVFSSEKLF